jgi:hypothetical protein
MSPSDPVKRVLLSDWRPPPRAKFSRSKRESAMLIRATISLM